MSERYVDQDNQSNLCIEQIQEAMQGAFLPLYGISESHSHRNPNERWGDEEYAIIKLGVHHLQISLDAVDCYRSHAGAIVDIISLENYYGLEFFPNPIAMVKIVEFDKNSCPENNREKCEFFYGRTKGWKLVDESGHMWLEVGTSNYDDYYPVFFCRWHPKEQ